MSDALRAHRPLYRVFHLNRAGGIDCADIIEALDDQDAIQRVHALAANHAVELWDRARFIVKIEPPLNALVPEPVIVGAPPDTIGTLAGVEGPAAHQMPKLVH